MLNHLDLFSGVGGFALAAKWVGGIQTTQFVEIDPWCRKRLNQNFPGVSTHDDIATFTSHRGEFDLFTAGFPCQDISVAGHQKGVQKETRSGLFFEIIRLIRECRPSYVLLENVSALLSINGGTDMGTVLYQLSQVGYDAEWQTISAAALGANHKRDRIWIVAYPNSIGLQIAQWEKREAVQKWGMVSPDLERQELHPRYQRNELSKSPRSGTIAQSPRRNDGLPGGVDVAERLKALGNSIVPQVAEIPLRRILEIQRQCNL